MLGARVRLLALLLLAFGTARAPHDGAFDRLPPLALRDRVLRGEPGKGRGRLFSRGPHLLEAFLACPDHRLRVLASALRRDETTEDDL